VTLLTASILGVLIMVLVAGTYFSGEEWDIRSDRKYIEELNENFAAVVKEKQLILGLNDKLFNSIQTTKLNEEHFQNLIRNLEKQISNKKKINRDYAEYEYYQIVDRMRL